MHMLPGSLVRDIAILENLGLVIAWNSRIDVCVVLWINVRKRTFRINETSAMWLQALSGP